jgi:hypothetical protein
MSLDDNCHSISYLALCQHACKRWIALCLSRRLSSKCEQRQGEVGALGSHEKFERRDPDKIEEPLVARNRV